MTMRRLHSRPGRVRGRVLTDHARSVGAVVLTVAAALAAAVLFQPVNHDVADADGDVASEIAR